MSHFTVLVIAADIAAALQPFHEFECTGTDDQYVQEIDETQEKRDEYAADTEHVLFDPAGTRYYLFTAAGDYDIRFSKPGEGLMSYRREQFTPPGWTEGTAPASERRTFSEWLQHDGRKPLASDGTASDEHKYGYYVADAAGEVVKVVRRTNPNKTWDWWTVGGRWPNKLLFKDGTRGNEGTAGQVDWDGMLADQTRQAALLFDKITAEIAGREVQSWAQVLKRRDAGELTMEQARDFYNAQPVIVDLQARQVLDSWDGTDQLNGVVAAKDRQQYIDRESKINSTTWALLHNGHWSERGSMGWWGMSDATAGSTLDYAENFWLTARSLSADAHLAVVDCHI